MTIDQNPGPPSRFDFFLNIPQNSKIVYCRLHGQSGREQLIMWREIQIFYPLELVHVL